MVLDELISGLSDEKESLTGLLRKMKVFLHQIGQKGLVEWVQFELSGYPSNDLVPDYRRLPSHVLANVASIAWRATAHPVPTMHLPPDMREFCEAAVVTQSVAVVEEWSTGDGHQIRRHIPMEMNGFLDEALAQGVRVQSAWCETPIADVRNILTQVRARLLDFLLELKDRVGDVQGPEQVKNKVATLDTAGLFHNAIFGPNTTILVGNQSAITSTQSVKVVELADAVKDLVAQLTATLPTSGFPEDVRAKAEGQLAELRLAANLPKPDPGRLRRGLEALRRIMEHATGHLIAAGAIATIAHILAQAHG